MHYLGVDSVRIIASIEAAVDFLEKHSTGPAMQKTLRDFRTAGGVKALRQAKTDKDFRAAMHATHATHTFVWMRDFLEHHALADTEGRGEKIYKELSAWNALQGAITMAYTPLNAEVDAAIAADCAPRLPGPVRDLIKNDLAGMNPEQVKESLRQITPYTVRDLDKAINRIVKAAQKGPDKARAAFLNEGGMRERHVLLSTLQHYSGLTREHKELRVEPALQRYGVLVGPKAKGAFNSARDFANEVDGTLSPFRAIDEVDMTAIGLHGSDRGNVYVVFNATARAAQAVADAFPDKTVAAPDGNRIAPRPPQLPAP